MPTNTKILTPEQANTLILTLKTRFEANTNRHQGLEWAEIQAKLETSSEKLWSIRKMEQSGGEPDVVDYDEKSSEYIFFDCSAESPVGRRSLCYDHEAWVSRKNNKPQNSALNMASSMGVDVLTEEQYKALQKLGKFDTKTSSWIITPSEIRKLGGALFCDQRYDQVFTYHNGAESYYASRGFRSSLKV